MSISLKLVVLTNLVSSDWGWALVMYLMFCSIHLMVKLGMGVVPAVWQLTIFIWNRSHIVLIRSLPPWSLYSLLL